MDKYILDCIARSAKLRKQEHGPEMYEALKALCEENANLGAFYAEAHGEQYYCCQVLDKAKSLIAKIEGGG